MLQPDPQLSPHFRLSELTFSQVAVRRGLDNVPGPDELANLGCLAQLLEVVRKALGVPVIVSSGFRSPAVNTAVGGSKRPPSAHLFGRAADFTAPSFGPPLAVCRRLVELAVPFDQLIYEGAWVHLGIAAPNVRPRQQVLTAVFRPGRATRYITGI